MNTTSSQLVPKLDPLRVCAHARRPAATMWRCVLHAMAFRNCIGEAPSSWTSRRQGPGCMARSRPTAVDLDTEQVQRTQQGSIECQPGQIVEAIVKEFDGDIVVLSMPDGSTGLLSKEDITLVARPIDLAAVFSPGDTIVALAIQRVAGTLQLSTEALETEPGAVLTSKESVFDQARKWKVQGGAWQEDRLGKLSQYLLQQHPLLRVAGMATVVIDDGQMDTLVAAADTEEEVATLLSAALQTADQEATAEGEGDMTDMISSRASRVQGGATGPVAGGPQQVEASTLNPAALPSASAMVASVAAPGSSGSAVSTAAMSQSAVSVAGSAPNSPSGTAMESAAHPIAESASELAAEPPAESAAQPLAELAAESVTAALLEASPAQRAPSSGIEAEGTTLGMVECAAHGDDSVDEPLAEAASSYAGLMQPMDNAGSKACNSETKAEATLAETLAALRGSPVAAADVGTGAESASEESEDGEAMRGNAAGGGAGGAWCGASNNTDAAGAAASAETEESIAVVYRRLLQSLGKSIDEPESKAQAEAQKEVESEAESKPEARAGTNAEAQTELEPGVEVEGQAEAKAEVVAEIEVEGKVQVDAVAEATPAHESKQATVADMDAPPELEAWISSMAEAEAGPTAQAKPGAEDVTRTKGGDQAQAEVEATAPAGKAQSDQAAAERHTEAQGVAQGVADTRLGSAVHTGSGGGERDAMVKQEEHARGAKAGTPTPNQAGKELGQAGESKAQVQGQQGPAISALTMATSVAIPAAAAGPAPAPAPVISQQHKPPVSGSAPSNVTSTSQVATAAPARAPIPARHPTHVPVPVPVPTSSCAPLPAPIPTSAHTPTSTPAPAPSSEGSSASIKDLYLELIETTSGLDSPAYQQAQEATSRWRESRVLTQLYAVEAVMDPRGPTATAAAPGTPPSLPPGPTLQVGDITTGKITKIVPYGAFVKVSPGTTALLHVTQVSHQRVQEMSDVFSVGEVVRALVFSTSMRQGIRRVLLSTKKLEQQPGDMLRDRAMVYREADCVAARFKQLWGVENQNATNWQAAAGTAEGEKHFTAATGGATPAGTAAASGQEQASGQDNTGWVASNTGRTRDAAGSGSSAVAALSSSGSAVTAGSTVTAGGSSGSAVAAGEGGGAAAVLWEDLPLITSPDPGQAALAIMDALKHMVGVNMEWVYQSPGAQEKYHQLIARLAVEVRLQLDARVLNTRKGTQSVLLCRFAGYHHFLVQLNHPDSDLIDQLELMVVTGVLSSQPNVLHELLWFLYKQPIPYACSVVEAIKERLLLKSSRRKPVPPNVLLAGMRLLAKAGEQAWVAPLDPLDACSLVNAEDLIAACGRSGDLLPLTTMVNSVDVRPSAKWVVAFMDKALERYREGLDAGIREGLREQLGVMCQHMM